MVLLERVKNRLPTEDDDTLLIELIQSVSDRICLRLGVEVLPALFNSICVEATVKAYRRQYYEGISSESADTLNTSFFEDILGEYDDEFRAYLTKKEKEDLTLKKKVRFI